MPAKKTFYSAKQVEQLRQQIRGVLKLTPEQERRLPEGFSKSPVDPTAAAKRLRCLDLKKDFVLRAYQFYDGANGNGFVFAMPRDALFPEPDECIARGKAIVDHFPSPPRPRLALRHYMDAFEGDSSPVAYLEASVIYRELAELGAIWHGLEWTTHTILDCDPLAPHAHTPPFIDEDSLGTDKDWTWRTSRPKDWRPVVQATKTRGATVRFISFTALGQSSFHQHTDKFSPKSYRPRTSVRCLAVGPSGYIF